MNIETNTFSKVNQLQEPPVGGLERPEQLPIEQNELSIPRPDELPVGVVPITAARSHPDHQILFPNSGSKYDISNNPEQNEPDPAIELRRHKIPVRFSGSVVSKLVRVVTGQEPAQRLRTHFVPEGYKETVKGRAETALENVKSDGYGSRQHGMVQPSPLKKRPNTNTDGLAALAKRQENVRRKTQ